MNYKLINSGTGNKADSIITTVLYHRGISEPEKYLNLNASYTNDYTCLDNINEAVECFNKHFERRDDVAILVDCDP